MVAVRDLNKVTNASNEWSEIQNSNRTMRFTFYSLLGGFIGTTRPLYIRDGTPADDVEVEDDRYIITGNETEWAKTHPFGINNELYMKKTNFTLLKIKRAGKPSSDALRITDKHVDAKWS